MAATHPELAGTLVGRGAGEVARRALTDSDMEALVRAEAGELRSAAEEYRRSGQAEEAERLLAQAAVLTGCLGAADSD